MSGRGLSHRLGAGILAIGLATPLAAQSPDDELRREVESLRQQLQELKQEVQEIRTALSRSSVRPAPAARVLDVGGRPFRGERTAPLTLVEFSDYQCPYCARFVRETYPEIEAAYVRTGKLKVVFFDFPLMAIHPLAFRAAEAARCAGDQGRYWEMHDRLFALQPALDAWAGHAEALGLDAAAFEACFSSGRHTTAIRDDIEKASALAVRMTPTFVIGATRPDGSSLRVLETVLGSKPFAVFKERIDTLLAEHPSAGEAGPEQ